MEQFSIYSKIAIGQASAESERMRVRRNCPLYGCVEMMTLTEKQYAARDILVSSVRKPRNPLGVQLTLDF